MNHRQEFFVRSTHNAIKAFEKTDSIPLSQVNLSLSRGLVPAARRPLKPVNLCPSTSLERPRVRAIRVVDPSLPSSRVSSFVVALHFVGESRPRFPNPSLSMLNKDKLNRPLALESWGEGCGERAAAGA